MSSFFANGEARSYVYAPQRRSLVIFLYFTGEMEGCMSRFHREECSHISVFHRGTAWSYIIPHREDTYSYVYIPQRRILILFLFTWRSAVICLCSTGEQSIFLSFQFKIVCIEWKIQKMEKFVKSIHGTPLILQFSKIDHCPLFEPNSYLVTWMLI